MFKITELQIVKEEPYLSIYVKSYIVPFIVIKVSLMIHYV